MTERDDDARDDAPERAPDHVPAGPAPAGEPAGGSADAADAADAPAPAGAPATAGGEPASPAPQAPATASPAPVPAVRARSGSGTGIEVPRARLAAQTRRDFLLFAAGIAAAASGAWAVLPDRARSRLLPGPAHDALDTLASRVGLTAARRQRALNRVLTFDDDIAEALYSPRRLVRTYDRSQVTPLRNNYDGRTPGPEILAPWALEVSGLASGRTERLALPQLLGRFALHGQVTRFVCVEGWSAIAWWGGIRTADFLAAYPPAPGARWAALRSAVNLDGRGRPNPYYVSLDLDSLRHPQTLLATHFAGRPLPLAHGAPLRLLVPVKLGLKNIKAITHVAYSAAEPPDYWNERGYSRYDGI